MARNDDGDRIATIGATDCTGLAHIAKSSGLLRVTDRGAIGNPRQNTPRGLLELGAHRIERNIEFDTTSFEVLGELEFDLIEDGGTLRSRQHCRVFDQVDGTQPTLGDHQSQHPNGAGDLS